jgi:sulfofructose kinase
MEKAARIAHENGIIVTVDVDTIYNGFERVLPHVDYLIASSEFPIQWTHQSDPLKALELIQEEYGIHCAAMTLGAHGALARIGGKFHYSPAFVVNCVDTTGAGDVFHGGFCYGVLAGWDIQKILDFSNAMAALNCTAIGARGGISTLDKAEALMSRAERRVMEEIRRRI